MKNIFLTASLKGIFGIIFILLFNFLLAGRWNYWQGWVFGLAMALLVIASLILFRDKDDLAQERMHPGPGVKWWDKILFVGFTTMTLATWVVGALDSGRFGWSPAFPIWAYLLSYILLFFAIFMFTWPMLENKWFSSMVRIQSDLGQQVVQTGPYKYVRHPGYVGGILMAIGFGLVFGSLWSLIPAGVTTVILVLRTYLEDNMLKKELPGYLEYTKKVKYRLIPVVW